MSKQNKENLFLLIKSLSKSEKRQFKLFVGRVKSNKDSKFIKLFNLLDKSTKYDELGILKKKFVTKQQLSNLKAHLYGQILQSLRMNPMLQDNRMIIREQIDFATVLYQKGLYKQSLKILEKGKNMSIDLDEKYSAFEIVEIEKLIESQYITRSMSNRADELINHSKSLSAENNLCSSLSNLSLQLYERLIKAGYAKSDEEFREITKFFFERLPKVNYNKLGFREKIWYCKVNVWYSLLIQDFLSSYKFSRRWVDLFDSKTSMISSHPVLYLKANNFLMEALVLIKYPKKFKEVLVKFEEIVYSNLFPKNDNISTLTFLYLTNNHLNLLFMEGKFQNGLKMIPNILSKINSLKIHIDPHHIMLIYYKIACLYFGCDRYVDSIKYLNLIIKNKELKMREDLLCFTRVLNLVAHYEAGFDYDIDKHIRETYKFLLKMNDLHEVQKLMIKFVRNLGNIYPHELKENFKSFHKELKPYENDPYERRAFLYLDILSWLESKILNMPISKIIQQKASKNLPLRKIPREGLLDIQR